MLLCQAGAMLRATLAASCIRRVCAAAVASGTCDAGADCLHGFCPGSVPCLPAAAAAQVGKFLAKYSQLEMFPVKLQVRVGGWQAVQAALCPAGGWAEDSPVDDTDDSAQSLDDWVVPWDAVHAAGSLLAVLWPLLAGSGLCICTGAHPCGLHPLYSRSA